MSLRRIWWPGHADDQVRAELRRQSALLSIRRGRRPTGADAGTLLKPLRKRRDVYAVIAEEIDSFGAISVPSYLGFQREKASGSPETV